MFLTHLLTSTLKIWSRVKTEAMWWGSSGAQPISPAIPPSISPSIGSFSHLCSPFLSFPPSPSIPAVSIRHSSLLFFPPTLFPVTKLAVFLSICWFFLQRPCTCSHLLSCWPPLLPTPLQPTTNHPTPPLSPCSLLSLSLLHSLSQRHAARPFLAHSAALSFNPSVGESTLFTAGGPSLFSSSRSAEAPLFLPSFSLPPAFTPTDTKVSGEPYVLVKTTLKNLNEKMNKIDWFLTISVFKRPPSFSPSVITNVSKTPQPTHRQTCYFFSPIRPGVSSENEWKEKKSPYWCN